MAGIGREQTASSVPGPGTIDLLERLAENLGMASNRIGELLGTFQSPTSRVVERTTTGRDETDLAGRLIPLLQEFAARLADAAGDAAEDLDRGSPYSRPMLYLKAVRMPAETLVRAASQRIEHSDLSDADSIEVKVRLDELEALLAQAKKLDRY